MYGNTSIFGYFCLFVNALMDNILCEGHPPDKKEPPAFAGGSGDYRSVDSFSLSCCVLALVIR